MITCYLGLGSNLQKPERQLRQAINHLRKRPRLTLSSVSMLYSNPAIGRRAQPPFYNCVVEIKTTNSPHQLLAMCLALEKKHRRHRKIHWGARTLDVDILLYGQKCIKQHHLIIPHPRMLERDFVLIPLLSIKPNILETHNLSLC
jgi:2-amino-4-hydroxy-6-hydroxymethyldihydropteridine diphosphokinase